MKVCLACLIVSIGMVGVASADESAPRMRMLFEPASEGAIATLRSAGATRGRIARLEMDAEGMLAVAGGSVIQFNLFDDVTYVGRVEQRTRNNEGSHTLTGTLDDIGGSFTLVVNGDVVSGYVHGRWPQRYRIRPQASGLHLVELIEEDTHPSCGVDEEEELPFLPNTGTIATHDDCDRDDGSVVDLLVVYTGAAQIAAGGQAAIEADIALHVARANEIYTKSGIISKLRLVHTQLVNYDENGSLSEHRSRLTIPNDGIMDEVHTLRDEYGADIVSLYYDQHTDKACWGSANDGDACADASDCQKLCSGGSNDGLVCTVDTDCGQVCLGGLNDGLACASSADCPSDDGTCVMSVCSGGARNGDGCAVDSDCEGNNGTCDGRCTGGCSLQYTGMAWQLQQSGFTHAFAAKAFNVVRWSGPDWLLAHETGHNRGAGHDRDNTQSGGLFSHSWGQRWVGNSDGACKGGDNHGASCAAHGDCPGGVCKRGVCNINGEAGDDCADDSDCPSLCIGGADHGGPCSGNGDCDSGLCGGICTRWRTVMAYAPGTVVDHFSNSSIDYDGQSTGTPIGQPGESNNAKTINDSRVLIANLRGSNYWVDFNHPIADPEDGCEPTPYDELAEGMAAAPKGGTIHIKAGSTVFGGTYSKRMRVEASGGLVRIGAP